LAFEEPRERPVPGRGVRQGREHLGLRTEPGHRVDEGDVRVNRLLARRRDTEREGGFTIIEIVVAMSLLSLVMVIILSSLWSVQKSETFARGREAAIDNMRISLNRISRDLRQATNFTTAPTPSHVDFYTYINGLSAHVVYDVTGGVITRSVNGGAAVVMHK